MKQVKGTWMVDLVKVIRANKDKDFSAYLADEDWKIINSKVLSSAWYPLDSYKRIGQAVFEKAGNSDVNASLAFGRTCMKNLLEIYKNLLENDPVSSVEKFYGLWKTFFKELDSHGGLIEKEPGRIKVEINILETDGIGEVKDSFAYQLAGSMQELIEQNGGKDTSVDINSEGGRYIVELTWS